MIDRRRFLGTTVAAAVAAAISGSETAVAEVPKETKGRILQAKGLQVVEGDRVVRLRGVNLGGWMLIEDYMIGLPWTEWKIREQFLRVLGEEKYKAFFDAYDESYVAEADIAFLAQQGFTLVRLPFNYRHFESDLAPGKWIEAGFRQLERVVGLCRKHKLWVLLDLHAAPGAQARDQNAGSAYGEAYLWNYKHFMDRTVALWKEIARRYRGDATVAGYNILCEPVVRDVELLNRFYASAIRGVREVDPDHIIALDSNLWGRDIASLHDQLFEDPQVIPVLHHYYSDDPAFAHLTGYPGTADGKVCDRAALAATLNGKYDQKRIARPTMASEFGVVHSDPQPFDVQVAITRDLVSIFEEKGWGWAMWCYKDIRDMGILTVKAKTPWREFLESTDISGFFSRYHELEKTFTENVRKMLATTDIDGDTREQWAREVGRDFDAPALDFVLRRLSSRSATDLAAMARSFSFENCDVHRDQLGALTPFLGKR